MVALADPATGGAIGGGDASARFDAVGADGTSDPSPTAHASATASARRLLDVVHRRLRDDDRRPVPLALAARAVRAGHWLGQDRANADADAGARAKGLAVARARIRRALEGPLSLSVAPIVDTAPAPEARLTPAALAEVLQACREGAGSRETGQCADGLCRRWFALARQTVSSRPSLDTAAAHVPLWLAAGQRLGDAAMVDFALILAEWVGRHQRLSDPGTADWGGIARTAQAPGGTSAGRAVALVVGLRAARLNGDRVAEQRLRRMALAALHFVDGWWRSTRQETFGRAGDAGAAALALAGLLTLAGAVADDSAADLFAFEALR